MLQQLAALLAALTLTTGANVPLSQNAKDFASLITDTNAAHAEIDAPRAGLSTYRYDFANGMPLFTAEDGKLLKAFDGNRPSPEATISVTDAKKEVEWIFRLLRMQYGLYQWSGGDAAFAAAQSKILSALPQSDTITLESYDKLLTGNLDFIRDAHFMINRTSMWHPQQVFSNDSRPFYRENSAFYADEACTRKVISVNGAAPETMIHRAIGQQGELTWYLYTTAPTADSLKVAVQYADKTEDIILSPAYSFENTKSTVDRFAYAVQRGIPRVTINEMFFGNDDSSGWADKHDEALMQNVLKTADELKKHPAAVIDVSHNPGGNGGLPLAWFERYTGQEAQPNYCTMRVRASDTWLGSAYGAQTAAEIAARRTALDDSYSADGSIVDGAYYVTTPSAQFVANDGHALFVLTSRSTQSAAENFADVAHNLQNTVTIGSNTGGVLTNGANYGLKLPYSDLPFQFGECLFLWDKAYFEEGRGIAPDLYLTGENLDTRLELFLQRYAGATK